MNSQGHSMNSFQFEIQMSFFLDIKRFIKKDKIDIFCFKNRQKTYKKHFRFIKNSKNQQRKSTKK